MGTLDVRTDEAMETALLEQAAADAERLRNDPDDQAEMLAIQRSMGVAE